MIENDLVDVVERLIRELKPKSIRMEVAVQQFKGDAGQDGSPSITIDRTYLEANGGKRFYDEVLKIADGRTFRTTSYCDGKKTANVEYQRGDVKSAERVWIGYEFMSETRTGYYSAPEPFRYARVGLTPLQDVLSQAEKLGQSEVMGRPCDRYLFRDVKSGGPTQSLVYSLDGATSVPLMVAAYKDVEHVHENRPSWVWEAESLDVISGYHFPLKSKYMGYELKNEGGSETSRLHMTQSIEVKSLEYDASYPSTAFWPKSDSEITVIDTITGKSHFPASLDSANAPQVKVADPIQVPPTTTGGWPVWPGVVLSSSILIVALIFHLRSRGG